VSDIVYNTCFTVFQQAGYTLDDRNIERTAYQKLGNTLLSNKIYVKDFKIYEITIKLRLHISESNS
jgi:hypothetical protein